ncbi:MAG: hypothetical protein K2K56_09145 [Lachnospiraceae bacterium]|nr:hypothetical protein [Lachnospiraceae bacterium]
MKIMITVEIPASNFMLDIQVNQRQRIRTTLRVLAENRAEFRPFADNLIVRVKSNGRRISTEQTYEDADIYNGTVILLENLPKEI